MTGLAFERATADAFKHLGWQVEQTQASGDYGADVIARFDTACIVIQCKDWKAQTGLAAVQEVFFAQKHYRADLAIVVARSGFTRQAQKAAESTGVRLVRLSDLRRHCEFDRSVEASRARREREAKEKARLARELAEVRQRRAREEAEAREHLATQARAAKEREAAEEKVRLLAEKDRCAKEATTSWQQYDKAMIRFEGKSAIYDQRWAALIIPIFFASMVVFNSNIKSRADAIFLLTALGVGLFCFFFVVCEPGVQPVQPLMPRPADVPNPHGGRNEWQASPKEASSKIINHEEKRGRVVRWCQECSIGLNLPVGREGTVRCKCGAVFWTQT